MDENVRKVVESRSFKQKRGRIRNALIRQLKDKELYHEPYNDMVEQYLNLWDASQLLDDDIKERGVRILDARGNVKKNDSVAQLVNVIKQMNLVLDKLHLQAEPAKEELGGDI